MEAEVFTAYTTLKMPCPQFILRNEAVRDFKNDYKCKTDSKNNSWIFTMDSGWVPSALSFYFQIIVYVLERFTDSYCLEPLLQDADFQFKIIFILTMNTHEWPIINVYKFLYGCKCIYSEDFIHFSAHKHTAINWVTLFYTLVITKGLIFRMLSSCFVPFIKRIPWCKTLNNCGYMSFWKNLKSALQLLSPLFSKIQE